MINANDMVLTVIELTEEEATRIIAHRGLQWRIIQRDDNKYIITRDFRRDRINLVIKEGIVTGATCG